MPPAPSAVAPATTSASRGADQCLVRAGRDRRERIEDAQLTAEEVGTRMVVTRIDQVRETTNGPTRRAPTRWS
jgi:hypothetical protein